MKNIYDLLNNTKVNMEDYEVTELNDMEKASMKRLFQHSQHTAKKTPYRWAAVAACMVGVVCFSQTAFAQTVIDGILQDISTGHNHFVQVDPTKAKACSEQYYDKDGKPITSSNKPKGTFDIYDADGKKVSTVTTSDTTSKLIIEKDINKAASHLSFKPLIPKALPAGCAFDHAGLYPDKNGKASDNCDYIDLYYTSNGKSIYVQQRRITPDTAYATGTDGTIEKLKVNGHDAVLMDGQDISWEANGVSVSISAKGLTRDELLTLAKSFS